ncbi:MAG: hypothetical protein KA294_02040 [Giesbergeria sp.]|nr:hypothetical protein [Giesbergeria sp.]MBP6418135.1 hypothetical protein [Giesbergeria sp.]
MNRTAGQGSFLHPSSRHRAGCSHLFVFYKSRRSCSKVNLRILVSELGCISHKSDIAIHRFTHGHHQVIFAQRKAWRRLQLGGLAMQRLQHAHRLGQRNTRSTAGHLVGVIPTARHVIKPPQRLDKHIALVLLRLAIGLLQGYAFALRRRFTRALGTFSLLTLHQLNALALGFGGSAAALFPKNEHCRHHHGCNQKVKNIATLTRWT